MNPGGTGGWVCINNNNTNMGRYTWNLNGGVLAMNQATIFLTADPNPLTSNLNLRPVMNFNGGTLKALSDQPTEMFDHRYNLVAQAKGGTIDLNTHFLNFTAPISHDATLGSALDGGMAIVDSVGGGNLTYSVANTYTGPTKIGAGATLTLGACQRHAEHLCRQPGRRQIGHGGARSRYVGLWQIEGQRQFHPRSGDRREHSVRR